MDDMDLRWLEASRLRPLRRVEFEQLAATGAFDADDDRVELLRGFLLKMPPMKPPHGFSVDQLAELLYTRLSGRARVRVQGALALSDDSEPQPDLYVYPEGDYRTENPSAALLLIEVADSSLRFDRGFKRDLYAECGVPEYWIVNLADGVLEVLDRPENGAFTRTRTFRKGESVAPAAFPDLVVEVSRILP
jgi:Uma2 family endonuclease